MQRETQIVVEPLHWLKLKRSSSLGSCETMFRGACLLTALFDLWDSDGGGSLGGGGVDS